MVALTTLTLWSLGQAIVVTPDDAARVPACRLTAQAGDGDPRLTGRRHPLDERPHLDSCAAISGSSASAAATAVSIAVRHRMPSAVAARRISAASRTAPDRGVGVLTTRRTSPAAMQSRIGTSPMASSGASPSLATGRAS